MSEPLPANACSAAESTGPIPDTTLSAPSLPQSPMPNPRVCLEPLPAVFGPYRLVKLLGHGGMGTVFLAEDTRLGRNVALKIPHFAASSDPRHQERFRREAQIAATFHHPHLCPVYDVGDVEGIPYVTMPYLHGEPLSALLQRQGRLPPEQAVHLAQLVAEAVEVAHAAGVCHRDLKPANIMVNERGEPVVMDFGLARQTTVADVRLTGPVVLMGTPAYAPPEQMGGHRDTLGPSCDVYSLGATLYEMLTGRLPFEGQLDEVLQQVQTQEPKPPSHLVPTLDSSLDAICLRALAKHPATRFPSMAAFAQALAQARTGSNGTLPARRESVATVLRPLKRRAVALAIGLVLLLLLSLLAGRFLISSRLLPQGPRAGSSIDTFQAGTRWSGSYEWLPPLKGGGDLWVTVNERNGSHFKGTYTTREKGNRFEWRIEGEVESDRVQWRFTEVIHEVWSTGVVRNARVQGKLDGSSLELNYRDADTAARLHLRLDKE